MNPDLKSVGVVLFSRGFLAMNARFLKRLIRLFFAWNLSTRPEDPLPGKLFARNLSALDGRDAKVAVGGELTNSNSHSIRRHTVLFQTGQARNKP